MNFLLTELKEKQGLKSVRVIRASEDYFDLTYEERVKQLGAESTAQLCKTIIMQNTRHNTGIASFPEAKSDPTYPKNIIVITQFEGKHNSNRIVNIMKKYQNENSGTGCKVSTKGFKFRHTEEEEALTLSGYEFNAITPFFMDSGGEEMPIILS